MLKAVVLYPSELHERWVGTYIYIGVLGVNELQTDSGKRLRNEVELTLAFSAAPRNQHQCIDLGCQLCYGAEQALRFAVMWITLDVIYTYTAN